MIFLYLPKVVVKPEDENPLDIEFPQIIENIIRDEEKIASIDVKNIKFNVLEFKNLEKNEKKKKLYGNIL